MQGDGSALGRRQVRATTRAVLLYPDQIGHALPDVFIILLGLVRSTSSQGGPVVQTKVPFVLSTAHFLESIQPRREAMLIMLFLQHTGHGLTATATACTGREVEVCADRDGTCRQRGRATTR